MSGQVSAGVVEKTLDAPRNVACLPTGCKCYLCFWLQPDNWMSSLAGVDGSPNKSRKRNSSKHLFSSALFEEIPTVEPDWDGPCFQWLWELKSALGEGWWVSHCWDQWNGRSGSSRDYHEITGSEKTKVGWLPRHSSIYSPTTGFWHRQGCPLWRALQCSSWKGPQRSQSRLHIVQVGKWGPSEVI